MVTMEILEQYFKASELLDKKRERINKILGFIRSPLEKRLKSTPQDEPEVELGRFLLQGTDCVLRHTRERVGCSNTFVIGFSVSSWSQRLGRFESIWSEGIKGHRLAAEFVVAVYDVLPEVVNHFIAQFPELGEEIARIQLLAK